MSIFFLNLLHCALINMNKNFTGDGKYFTIIFALDLFRIFIALLKNRVTRMNTRFIVSATILFFYS